MISQMKVEANKFIINHMFFEISFFLVKSLLQFSIFLKMLHVTSSFKREKFEILNQPLWFLYHTLKVIEKLLN